MGSCFASSEQKTLRCLSELATVDLLLREILMKYQSDVDKCEKAICNQNTNKSTKLYLVRRRKILIRHIEGLHKKLVAVTSKIFSVEQLCLIQKEIDSLRRTAKVFKQFAPIKRVEALTDTMEEQLEKMLDIEELLSTSTNDLNVDDDLLLLEKEVNSIEHNNALTPIKKSTVPINVVISNLDKETEEGAYDEEMVLLEAV